MFPFYLVLLPAVLPLMLVIKTWSTASALVKRSQSPAFSMSNYAVTVLAVVLTFFGFEHSLLIRAAMLIAALSLALVLISAITWPFNPFSWFYAVVDWPARFTAAPEKLQGTQFLANPKQSAEKLSDILSGLQASHKNLRGPLGLTSDFMDVLLVLGFTRKFVTSLVHASFLFALGAYGIAFLQPTKSAFTGLVPDTLQESLFSFFFYSFLTLVSGETGILASTQSAQLWLIASKLTSICFLVILVSTFSILSRERARETMDKLQSSKREASGRIEDRVFDVIVAAQAAGAFDPKAREVLLRFEKFANLEPERLRQWQGAMNTESAVAAGGPDSDLEERIASLSESERVRLRTAAARRQTFLPQVLRR